MHRKTVPYLMLGALLLPAQFVRGAGGDIPFPSALDAAAVVEEESLDNIEQHAEAITRITLTSGAEKRLDNIERHGLVIGNGDLNALLYAEDNTLRMRITKNDVWDARVDTSQDPAMAVIDVAKHSWKGGAYTWPSFHDRPYPLPRVCANLILSGEGPIAQGKKSAKWRAKLDLRRAVAEVAWPVKGESSVRVRALAQRNVFLIEGRGKADITSQPASYLPAAEQGETEGVKWICQRMPGDVDYAGMEVATALGSKGGRTVAAVATSWEAKDAVAAAVTLVRETLADDAAALVREHEQQWSRFWAASGVELGDRDFQDWWYRMVYYLRCFSKPGVVPIGLWAGLPDDTPGWHSDYHLNYNNWQTFWTSFPINHPEMADPLVQYLKQYLPRARWFAKATYGCDGAYLNVSLFPFEPNPAHCKGVNRRQVTFMPYSYTIGMGGMAMHNLWLCHLYHPDRAYLKESIYPVLREVALFYASFMEKCRRRADGKVILGPSYSPEEGPMGVDDTSFDIAFIRFTFNAQIEAAKVLGCDAELVQRCQRMRDLLPPYPTAPDPNGNPVVVDWAGCKLGTVDVHSLTVPLMPVFPGDQVTWFSPEGEKALFKRTIGVTRYNHNNSNIIANVARARLSMPEAVTETRSWFKDKAQPNGMFAWQGHGVYLSESAAVAALVSEFLVQSVGDVIRIFPCWPKELPASFADLGAQGGFLVSAQLVEGKAVALSITSTVGGTLRVLSPWAKIAVAGHGGASSDLTPDARGIVTIETAAGQRLVFSGHE